MEIFNVIIALQLLSICCEGKSDLAEIKCQEKIMNVTIGLKLYRSSGRMWLFKASILDYINHVYLDSGNVHLFDPMHNAANITSLKEILKLVETDIAMICDEWH